MKKIFAFLFLLFSIFYFLFFSSAWAQTPSHISPTSSMIDQLKERIASRVAQLKLVERRGVIGTVTISSNTQITLIDVNGNNRFVDVDEISKFSSPKNTDSFGISDITKGAKLGVLGLYNKESQRMLGRFINLLILPQFVHGTISNIDKENYEITVTSSDQKQTDIEAQNTTKTYSYTKDADLVRSGFTKLKTNVKVAAVVTPDTKNSNKMIGLRIVQFPEIQISATPTPSPTTTKKEKEEAPQSSTKSGEKKTEK